MSTWSLPAVGRELSRVERRELEHVADPAFRDVRSQLDGMKPILLTAASDEGVVSASDVFDCSHGERGGEVLHDASPFGQVALPEMLSRSSNVGFAPNLRSNRRRPSRPRRRATGTAPRGRLARP
jgi:hypothetical protein